MRRERHGEQTGHPMTSEEWGIQVRTSGDSVRSFLMRRSKRAQGQGQYLLLSPECKGLSPKLSLYQVNLQKQQGAKSHPDLLPNLAFPFLVSYGS